MVTEELFGVLMQFHREVALPDMQRLEERMIDRMDSLHRETLTHFDAMYKRFDRLESEYHALSAASSRLEERVARLEDHVFLVGAPRHRRTVSAEEQIAELRGRIAALEVHVGVVGGRLDGSMNTLRELETRVSALEQRILGGDDER